MDLQRITDKIKSRIDDIQKEFYNAPFGIYNRNELVKIISDGIASGFLDLSDEKLYLKNGICTIEYPEDLKFIYSKTFLPSEYEFDLNNDVVYVEINDNITLALPYIFIEDFVDYVSEENDETKEETKTSDEPVSRDFTKAKKIIKREDFFEKFESYIKQFKQVHLIQENEWKYTLGAFFKQRDNGFYDIDGALLIGYDDLAEYKNKSVYDITSDTYVSDDYFLECESIPSIFIVSEFWNYVDNFKDEDTALWIIKNRDEVSELIESIESFTSDDENILKVIELVKELS